MMLHPRVMELMPLAIGIPPADVRAIKGMYESRPGVVMAPGSFVLRTD